MEEELIKRRYSLSLTPENVDRFHAIAKKFHAPKIQMSLVCDDAILEWAKMMELAASKGSFTMTDLFKMIGEQMELIVNPELERKKDNDEECKKTAAA
jgi:hypothetical protein